MNFTKNVDGKSRHHLHGSRRGLQKIWQATGIGFILLAALIHFEPRALIPHLFLSLLVISVALFMTQREIRRYLFDFEDSEASEVDSESAKK